LSSNPPFDDTDEASRHHDRINAPRPAVAGRYFVHLSTVAIGQFSDCFLYVIAIPVLPYLLRDRLGFNEDKIQSYVSVLLAAFSGASLLFGVPAGLLVDLTTTRRLPYLLALIALTAATVMFAYAEHFVWLFVSRVLQGLSASVVYVAAMAMVVDTTGSNNLGKTLGTVC